MRYFVRFAYKGTDFHGSQWQPQEVTVQETMENAFSIVLRMPIDLTFAGRTDAGVHAREMWAHFDYPQPCEGKKVQPNAQLAKNLAHRLNCILPDSIAIYSIVPVCADAHARFDAIRRTYEYHITTSKDVFASKMKARINPGLDFAAMNEAATLLLGRHDFASFCKVHTDVKTTFCTVTKAEWIIKEDGDIYFTIAADRFLRNMVRAVVGTLFEVGRGKMTKAGFRDVIEQKNRCAAGQSAPADGLYLTRVEYPQEIFIATIE